MYFGNKCKRLSILVCISLSMPHFLSDLALASGPESRPAPSQTEYAFTKSVQECLGIPDRGVDVLPKIAAVVSSQNAGAAVEGAAISELVDALLGGPSPNALLEQILPRLDVHYASGSQVKFKNWKYGSALQKRRLIDTMWRLATDAKSKSPKRASEIAKAALMLAALNDFEGGWRLLSNVVEKDADSAKLLLGLSDTQFKKLTETVQLRSKESALFHDEDNDALRGIDAIHDAKAPVTTEQIKAVLRHEDRAFRDGPKDLGSRHWVVCNTWDFLNLMRSRHDEQAQRAIREQLEQWKRDFPSPYIGKWVDEALSLEGPAPGKMIVDYVQQPDGKLVPVNTQK